MAARRYGIAPDEWLDLSTGINPNGWPVPMLPADCWQRLPEDDDELTDAAREYYGCNTLLPVAGSQQAIMALPGLRRRGRVGLLKLAYAEHAQAWAMQGHDVVFLEASEIDAAVSTLDVLLLINPNNPTGLRFSPDHLLAWGRRLRRNGGWLIVDEAFADTEAGLGLAPAVGREGLIVLRSVGKFFGLAGARVGFVLAWPALLAAVRRQIGPWPISAPARHLVAAALRDGAWQRTMARRLRKASGRLARLLAVRGLVPDGGCDLFQWCRHSRAAEIHERLARQGILVRRFDEPASLRFGLPGTEAEWHRLASALDAVAGEEKLPGCPSGI